MKIIENIIKWKNIFCDCSHKQEFDFNREYFPSIEINYNQIKNDDNEDKDKIEVNI